MAEEAGIFEGYSDINRQTEEVRRAKGRIHKHITSWRRKVIRAKTHDKQYWKRWADDRKIARAEFEKPIRVNLIGAIMEILLAFLYAKDPDMNARPSDSVGEAKKEEYLKVAKTIEVVNSRLLKDAYLKKTAKRWVRGAMTVGCSWIKCAMQRRKEKDPVMEASINDLKEQIDKIKSKQIRIDNNEEGDPDVLIQELQANILAAEEQNERLVAEGLVLDYLYPEDVVVAPECGDVENYLAAPWIAFETYKSEDEVLAITEWDGEEAKYLRTAHRYTQRPRQGDPKESGEGYIQTKVQSGKESPDAESVDGFFKVVEIWALCDGVVYTYVDGCTQAWGRKPYAPVTGKRFYPVFQLGFHYIDGERYPQSDTYNLKDLQNEYLDVRSDFRKHRKRSRPGILFDVTKITEESVTKITAAETQEYIGVEMIDPALPLRDALLPKSYNPIDPGLYDTTSIIKEMEKIGGVQEALQQGAQVEKTATEARIQESGFGARTGSRRDQLEEVLGELCEYSVQLSLLTMDHADAMRYAGPEAVWVSLSVEDALTNFDIDIKAGSTGKPKANEDRDAWSTILPLLVENIERIGTARLAGQSWAADPWIAILAETLERLEDHADIQRFLPAPPDDVIAAAAQEEKDAEEELTAAKKISEIADAVEKIPALAELREVQELLGIGLPEQEALPPPGAPGQNQFTPAPSPID